MRQPPPAMAAKLMSAAELFAERGLDGTKTEDIAAVTGVPKATIYYYFEGKEQVLAFIFEVVLDAVREAVETAIDGPGTAADRLRAVVANHLQVFAAYPHASQALHFDLGRAARLTEISRRTNASFIDPVTALLAEGRDDGSLRPGRHPRLTAVAVLGAISTAAIHVTALDPGHPVEGLDAVILPLVMDGLTPRAAE